MLKKIFSPDPFKTFYVVFAYIVAFALWWAYLLYAKNETAFHEKMELNEITYRHENTGALDYKYTAEYKKLYAKYTRQRIMIITEGGVFILLLLFGLWRVRKAFLREMEVAELQRNFLLSITHELKSPLSTVKLSLQTMAKRKLEPEKSEKLISNSLVDVDRLVSLVDNILFAAKIERHEPGLSNEEINVSALVTSVTERFLENKKGISIQRDIQEDINYETDVTGFTSVVMNLLENAIKYSEPDTTIRVSLKDEKNKLVFTVADEGVGISKHDKERIFEKFYRVGNEDTRKTKGTGLGLYIVKRFVEIYAGNIQVEDNPPKGTIFRLSFAHHPHNDKPV